MRLPLPVAALLLMQVTLMADVDEFTVRETRFTGGSYQGETFRYLLLTPEVIEPETSYPLILFLHGAGERGSEVEKLKTHFLPAISSDEFRKAFPCFVVAPQCPAEEWWVKLPEERTHASTRLTEEPAAPLQMALQVVDDVVAEFPVDENRLYLTGISMGGYGSWDLAMRQPDRWAAVVPICGGGDESKGERLVGMPLWAVHGDADSAVPVERSRNMIAAIKDAGGDPRYTELPGIGHDSWTQTYADPNGVLHWMFQQRLDAREHRTQQ